MTAEEFDQSVRAEVQPAYFRSLAEVEDEFRTIGESIGDTQKDWEQRVSFDATLMWCTTHKDLVCIMFRCSD